jgi:hypothetical protein
MLSARSLRTRRERPCSGRSRAVATTRGRGKKARMMNEWALHHFAIPLLAHHTPSAACAVVTARVRSCEHEECDEASAKARSCPHVEPAANQPLSIWAGEEPLRVRASAPVVEAPGASGLPISERVQRYRRQMHSERR